MTDTFSALADPTRRGIIQLLANSGQLSATDISEKFPVTPPAISQHLKVLREAELVVAQRRGQQRLYQINPKAMSELEEWAKQTRKLWELRFDDLDELLKAEYKKVIKKKHGKSK